MTGKIINRKKATEELTSLNNYFVSHNLTPAEIKFLCSNMIDLLNFNTITLRLNKLESKVESK